MIPYRDKVLSCLAIFLVTFVGAVVPLFISSYYQSKSFNLALGFSGGILLSGGLMHLLPEAISDLEEIKKKTNASFNIPLCEIFVVFGILLIIIVEQISDHLIQRRIKETKKNIRNVRSGLMTNNYVGKLRRRNVRYKEKNEQKYEQENEQEYEYEEKGVAEENGSIEENGVEMEMEEIGLGLELEGGDTMGEEEGPNESTCCSKCYNIFFYANKFDYINFLNLIKSKEFEDNTMYCINLKDYKFFNTDKDYVKQVCLSNSTKLNVLESKSTKEEYEREGENEKQKEREKEKEKERTKEKTKEILDDMNNVKGLTAMKSFMKNKLKYKTVPISHNRNMLLSKLNEEHNDDDDYTCVDFKNTDFGDNNNNNNDNNDNVKRHLLLSTKNSICKVHTNNNNNNNTHTLGCCNVNKDTHTNGNNLYSNMSNSIYRETEIKCDDKKCDDINCDDIKCNDVICDDIKCDDIKCGAIDEISEAVVEEQTTENNKYGVSSEHGTFIENCAKYNNNNNNDNTNNNNNNKTSPMKDDIIYFMKTFDSAISKKNIYLENNNELLKSNFNNTPIILLLAFSFHSIIEGITLGSVKNSFITSFSIICHKSFASFSVGVNLLSRKLTIKKYILFMCLFSLMTPLGILIGFLTNIYASESSLSNRIQFFPCILESIGSGTFIYISLFEIIGPLLYTYRIHNHCMHSKKNFHYYKIQHKIQIIMMITLGACLMFLLTFFF